MMNDDSFNDHFFRDRQREAAQSNENEDLKLKIRELEKEIEKLKGRFKKLKLAGVINFDED